MRLKTKPTPPADGVIKSLGQLVQKAEGAADAKPVFRITSEVLDRHRDRVKTDSLKIENYEKNPVLLWNHNDWEPAIGTCRVFQEGGEWFMEPSFDGIGERSKDVAAKVAAKTLRTCSIRFRFLKYAYNEEGGLDYEEVELLEVSITNIPANPEAHRVKNQDKPGSTTQKNDTPPPPEEETSKALEPADLDDFRAVVKEELAPILATLEKLVGEKSAQQAPGTEAASEDAPPAAEEADEEGEGVEMTAEEEEELKSFMESLGKKPTPPKK